MSDPSPPSSDVARHDRPRATLRAPGADVPPATTAGAPGQYCLSAVSWSTGSWPPLAGPRDRTECRAVNAGPRRSRPPKWRRVMADPSPRHPTCAGHDRPRATPRAPGADVPPATTAGAPGQYRLSAVPSAPDHDRSSARHKMAPGHGRPLAASSGVRRGMTVRAPPSGHRVLTYPWPLRPGRRVSIV